MTGRALAMASLHFIPQSQPVMVDCDITKILEKEVKPLFSRRSTAEKHLNERFSRTKAAHTAKATQQWCKKNLTNLIERDEWP